MKTTEEIINETFREVTGCSDARAISWTNVGKPVCLKIMDKVREQTLHEVIELVNDWYDTGIKGNDNLTLMITNGGYVQKFALIEKLKELQSPNIKLDENQAPKILENGAPSKVLGDVSGCLDTQTCTCGHPKEAHLIDKERWCSSAFCDCIKFEEKGK
jgi:hypothetical protein